MQLLAKLQIISRFQDFSVMCHENKEYLLELKERHLAMRDRPSMTQNIGSTPNCPNEFL